jgi:integrase
MRVQKGVSIHKQARRPNWFCSFRIFDTESGRWRWVFRSTGTDKEAAAREIARAWHKSALKGRKGELSVDVARDIIARGVADVFLHSNSETLEHAKIRSWCERWLHSKQIEASEATHLRYKLVIERFLSFLGSKKAARDLSSLNSNDVLRFRDWELKEHAPATANLGVRVLRICFGEAVRQELLTNNPAQRVKVLKLTEESKRRDFTLSEIKRVLAACAENQEWRGLVLFGLYLGQRLGDLSRLTWRAINLEREEIAFTARKTGRRIILPLVRPLLDYLSSITAVSDNPDAFIFPRSAAHKHTASLSNQFRDILVEAGLVEPRNYYYYKQRTSEGRASSAREASEISFHSLRHSAVTMLKAAGVSDFMARELVGHESSAVSRHYTHLSTDDKRNALQRVPDVTK